MFRLNKRSWIPIIGWILCYGFFNNCVIAPYFHVDLVDWEQSRWDHHYKKASVKEVFFVAVKSPREI